MADGTRHRGAAGAVLRLHLVIVVILLVTGARAAHAQTADSTGPPSVSGGFALPITFDFSEADDLNRGVAPALWAEAAFPMSSRVRFYSGLDWATPYEKQWRRGTRVTGSGTYQEIVLSEAVGVRLSTSSRTDVTALVGFGFVVTRITEVAEIASGGAGPSETSRTRKTTLDPSVLGGLNASIALNRRVSVIVRVRARVIPFTRLSITPSAGFQFALGAR